MRRAPIIRARRLRNFPWQGDTFIAGSPPRSLSANAFSSAASDLTSFATKYASTAAQRFSSNVKPSFQRRMLFTKHPNAEENSTPKRGTTKAEPGLADVRRFHSRRSLLQLMGLSIGVLLPRPSLVSVAWAQKVAWGSRKLKHGQFTWEPDRSPGGAVAIIVSV